MELNTRIVLRNDTTAAWSEANDPVLLKGEVGIEFDPSAVTEENVKADYKVKMKIGDGVSKWSELPYFGGEEAKYFEVGSLDEITETNLAVGDVAVVKTLIVGDKYSYAGYTWDGEAWRAMDGNYNAENVYFDEDLVVTSAIGTITKEEIDDNNGSVTLSASGKNVKEVFASLLAEEKEPTIKSPTYSLGASAVLNSTAEIGDTITGFKWDGTWSAGSYEYGSVQSTSTGTGITATYAVSENKENATSTELDGTFTLANAIEIDTVGSKTYGTITGTCTYSDSPYTPVTNIGNEAEAGAITGGSISKTAEVKVTGYRNSFYGVYDTKEGTGTTSDSIRELTKSGKTLSAGSSFAISVTATCQKVVIAYPASLRDMTSVLDKNDSNANIVSGFGTPVTISIAGANGKHAVDYKVYTMEFAGAYGVANTFTVTI